MKNLYTLALITGATSGIGEEFAKQLPEATNLILTGRNTEKLTQMQSVLQTQTRTVKIIAADLATPEGLASLTEKIKDEPIDLFINNAGLGYFGAMQTHTFSQEDAMVQVNIVAMAALTRALCPQMAKYAKAQNKAAGVIFVSSVAGFMAVPGFATYAATKMFGLSLAEALAEEYKNTPLQIQALCPGPTNTQFGARAGMPQHIKNTSMAAQDVVALSLKNLGKKRIVVPGLLNRASVWPARLLPRTWLTRLTATFIERTKKT